MLRDVDRDHLVEAFSGGFANNNSPSVCAQLRARIDQFNSYIPDAAEGDVMMFDYVPGAGTQVTSKGKLLGTVAGADFNTALLRVWLGPQPPTDPRPPIAPSAPRSPIARETPKPTPPAPRPSR